MKTFDKWTVLDAINWNPHPGQLMISESTARHKVASCGRRFGKSDLGGHELVPECLYTATQTKRLEEQMQRREFWIVGPEYCVDEETEILTSTGWRRQHELSGNETVLTLNMKTGLAEWQEMEMVSIFHTVEGLHRHVYESSFRGHSSVTTGEHRWPIRSGRHNILKWANTEGIGSSRDRLITVAPVSNLPTVAKYDDAFVELVAWYWTEGTWSAEGKTLEISQNEGPHLERIKAACVALFGEEMQSMRNGSKKATGMQWTSCTKREGTKSRAVRLSSEAATALRSESILAGEENVRQKNIDPKFVMSLTKAQLELFLNVSIWADGDRDWNTRTSVDFGQKYEHNIDILQMVCQMLGRRSQKAVREMNGLPWYSLSIYSANKTGEVGTNTVKRTQRKSDHEGIVWCPTTPNGTWLMRREGSVCFTGNSDSEKEFRVVWNELAKLEVPLDKPGSYNDPHGGDMHISCFKGKFQVHAKSAKYPDTLVGEALSGVIMAEAAKMKEKVWTKNIRPTLSDFKGWSLHTSTPEGKNHFYHLWQRGQDPGNPDWASWRMPSWVNPYVHDMPTRRADVKRLQELMVNHDIVQMALSDSEESGALKALRDKFRLRIDDEVIDLMGGMSIPSFNQEIGADFTDFVGRVFKDFDEEVHVGDLPYNPSWPTFAAIDYGYRNPNVWLVIQVGPWGEVNVIRELYQRELTINEFAREIKDRGLDRGVLAMYPDPSDPGNSNVLSDELHIPWRSGTGGELRDRLDAIRRALKERNQHVPRGHEDRRPTLMWDRSCTMSIYEMNEYRYPEEKEENSVPGQEKPLKKDDHSPEALGRFFAGHFSTPQEDAGPGRVSKAKMGRR